MSFDQLDAGCWTPDFWASLNDYATKTLDGYAQLRKLIPQGPDAPNAYFVELPAATNSGGEMGFTVNTPQPVTRLRVKFRIKSEQSHDAANIHALVHRVAAEMARVEDIVLAYGKDSGFGKDTADNLAAGLLTGGKLANPPAGAGAKEVLATLREGVKGVRHNYAGSLNAAFGFESWMALVQEEKEDSGTKRAKATLGTPHGHIGQIPFDSKHAPNGLAVAVFAPDPGALDLVWTQRPTITHVSVENGDAVLRLEEAFVLRIKDQSALASTPTK